MIRRTFVALALAGGLAGVATVDHSTMAIASQTTAYTPAALAAAQKSGGPVLVEVTAPWCPTCKAQKPILSKLLGSPKYSGYSVVQVDFDSQKDALKALNVRMQSTLIAFKGKTEVGRSTGDTDPASIESLLAKPL